MNSLPSESVTGQSPVSTASYKRLVELQQEIALLRGTEALLSWDQETYMPPRAEEIRARQIAFVTGMIHDRVISPEVTDLLGQAGAEMEGKGPEVERARANVRELTRLQRRELHLPRQLVEEMARTAALSRSAWVSARDKKDFSIFAPSLRKLVELKQEAARGLLSPLQATLPARGGASGASHDVDKARLYDALLEEFEPGETTTGLDGVFSELARELPPLIRKLVDSPKRRSVPPLQGVFPIEAQREFGRHVTEAMGFDYTAGRLDVTTHPFCATIGTPEDVRLTTRYSTDDFAKSLFPTVHECGHGLYEQGLRRDEWGMPMANAASSGVHESQSRLWENQVARSAPFWEHFYPKLQATFPALRDLSRDVFVLAINRVSPTMIRVESDEVTYNLHILLRYEMERDLVSGRISVSEVPGKWNRRMQELLGITPANDGEGCLQDIHWSLGLFGYFPTYTLGNVYAAQLFQKAREVFDLDGALRKGQLRELREWLRVNIHEKGMFYSPTELIEKATGKPRSASALVSYLRTKFERLYES